MAEPLDLAALARLETLLAQVKRYDNASWQAHNELTVALARAAPELLRLARAELLRRDTQGGEGD